MNSRTRCLLFTTFVIALLLLVTPQLFAQTCIQNEYNLSQGASATSTASSNALNCTANDVRIAKIGRVRDPVTGSAIVTCQAGQHFNFIADFQIVTTSSQARENIGLYISTDSQTQALTGSCVDNIISPRHACPTTAGGIQCGSDNYKETDAAPDNCGDTASGDFSSDPLLGGNGTEVVTIEVDNFLCQAPAGSTQVQLPNCTSWQIPGGTIQCVSPSPTYPYPFNGVGGKPTAVPGTKSKCNCGIIPLGVTVQTPGATVTKACTTNDTPGNTNTSCSISPEGGAVTYTVNISNQSNFGDIVVDQICDDQYGTVFRAGSYSGAACPAGNIGSKGTFGTTTCSALTVAQGASQSCTFTATQVENVVVTDVVSVVGHGATAGTFGPSGSNSVTVTSHEAATTGTITKGFVGNTAGCATVRYSVEVKNTSGTGTDESLNLSGLNDSAFGDITTTHGTGTNAVLGTTCGQASSGNGLGSLNTVAGAGAFPATIPVNNGTYTCQFDGQFCGAVDSSGCFSHSNTVSATLTDDENAVVSLTPGTLNLKECLTGTPQ